MPWLSSRSSSISLLMLACACTPPAAEGGELGESGTTESESGTSESETGGLMDMGEPDEEISLEWDEAVPELRLVRGDEVLLRFGADAFLLGEVEMLDDASSYDPVFVEPDAWRAISSAETIEYTPARLEVMFAYEGGAEAQLVIDTLAEGRYHATWTPEFGVAALAMMRLAPEVDAQEGFYGLGEYFDQPEHRGTVRALQIEYDPSLESNYNEAHVPVPLLTGTRGWGLFVADDHPMTFDVAASADDRVLATVGAGPDTPAGLSFYLFAAEHPLDITAHYYAVAGVPHRPAPWALGPWIWRDENLDQAEVETDIQTIRDLDLATSGIWVDRPYASGVNTFDFEAARFPDPQAMIDQAHALGLRVALWHTPYLDPDDPAVDALRLEAEGLGLFPPDTALLTSNWGEPLDFTNSDAWDWWQAHVQQYTDMGIEGFKLDYGEDVTVGINGVRTVWAFADGSSERTMHKGYSRFYHRAYQELLPDTGGFILARAGTHGDQVNVDVIWPGDLDATMTKHKEVFDSGGEMVTGVGGLPAAIVAGLSLGPSGFPLFASDTGGYRHSPPSPETFVRWVEHSAFMPVMQIGTSSNTVAWDFDDTVLGIYRELTRLHVRLFPYVWTHVLAGGRPIARPLGLAFPEIGIHPSFDYMLGDALLVAPVIDAGADTRMVSFPPGQWIHWFTGDVVDAPEGGATAQSIAAPLGTPPVFLRAGELVPMLRPTIDSLAPTSVPGTGPGEVDSYASDPGRLSVRTSPGPAAEFVLYDGTLLRQGPSADGFELEIAQGREFVSGVMFEVMGLAAMPSSVADEMGELPTQASAAALDGVERGYAFEGGVLWIKPGAGSHTVNVAT
jgi:alpha-D-xyloside xylohydrolase